MRPGERFEAVLETTHGPIRIPTGSWLVLFAFPKAFTQGCTRETTDFTRLYPVFQEEGVLVVGISPDPLERLERFAQQLGVPFPLASDPEHHILERLGAWGVKKLYGRDVRGVIRSTFLFTPHGELVREWQNVRVTGHAERVVEEVRARLKEAGI